MCGEVWHYVALLEHYYQGAIDMNVTLDGRTVTLTDEQLTMFDGLTKLQKGVGLVKLNQPLITDHEAYVAGGGRAKTKESIESCASELLSNPKLKAFLNMFKVDPSPTLARAIMTREDIISDLTDIANATIFDVMNFYTNNDELMNLETGEEILGQSTIVVKSMNEIDPKFHKLIKGVKQTKHGIELTLHDQMQARKQITDMCGYDAPKRSEISGPNGQPIQVEEITDEELETKLKELGLGRYHNQLGGKSVE